MAKNTQTSARFRVELPKPARGKAFTGEKLGVSFIDGAGQTEDARAAHNTLELGAIVHDSKTGQTWPEKEETDVLAT